jgi:K+-transporting ATPase ATPase A chain
MTAAGFFQLLLLVVALLVTAPFLGRYMAAVFGSRSDGSAPGDRFFEPIERLIYRVLQVDARREQRWKTYTVALLAFSLVSVLGLYALQRFQGSLIFNPTNRDSVAPAGAWNAAVSFVTNTNWQWFSGEQVMSHLTQMLGFAVQNFVSAAVGLAVAIALIRGITRSRSDTGQAGAATIGNFWRDLVRSVTRVLLPIAFVAAIVMVTQGVTQNFHGNTSVKPLDTTVQVSSTDDSGATVETPVTEQLIPGGPFASQESIKELGTNGGGPYNANSAHPFENPNGWTNILQIYLLLLIPISLTFTYGVMAGSRKQGKVLLAVMMALWLATSVGAMFAEQHGNGQLTTLGVDQSMSSTQVGGNMEGKEIRFGPSTCGLYAASTTGTSNGAVDCMHDSFTAIGGFFPMVNMMLGEVSPGGVGVGLMGMLINALMAVFIAGLMVGRTPEYLGKKIQAAEMKLVVLYIIAMPLIMKVFAAASVMIGSAVSTVQTHDAHGLSEILYNYASAANNNGSAFAYQGTGTDWYTTTQGIAMLVGRFMLIIPALAIAGSLARKRRVPATSGTFATDTPLFGGLLAGVVLNIAGLTFFPALALGPLVEHLTH